MNNPWDIPPLPTRGDENENTTYTEVGRFTTVWESIEFTFARLNSVFLDNPDGEGIGGYGTGKIFSERMRILNKNASSYFVRKPH